jgi:hypothetical protein
MFNWGSSPDEVPGGFQQNPMHDLGDSSEVPGRSRRGPDQVSSGSWWCPGQVPVGSWSSPRR